jgi:hypothetical protein
MAEYGLLLWSPGQAVRAQCKACGRAHAAAPLEQPETRAGRARMQAWVRSAPMKSLGARGRVGWAGGGTHWRSHRAVLSALRERAHERRTR